MLNAKNCSPGLSGRFLSSLLLCFAKQVVKAARWIVLYFHGIFLRLFDAQRPRSTAAEGGRLRRTVRSLFGTRHQFNNRTTPILDKRRNRFEEGPKGKLETVLQWTRVWIPCSWY